MSEEENWMPQPKRRATKAGRMLRTRTSVPWNTCRRESEISNCAERSSFIDRHIGHPNGAFLLVGPGMPLQIIIERFIATVEGLDLVLLFETTDDNSHSASHCPDEGFGRVGGFSRREICEALQFARRPGNLHVP